MRAVYWSVCTILGMATWGCTGPAAPAAGDQIVVTSEDAPLTSRSGSESVGTVEKGAVIESVAFPAAGVRLPRPDGFDEARNFHGFQQKETQSSVMVNWIAAPFSEMASGLTAARLKSEGVALLSREEVQIDGQPGILIAATQMVEGAEFAKWILLFGDEKNARMVTAVFPRSRDAELSATLREVVTGVRRDETPSSNPGEIFGMTLTATEKLQFTEGFSGGLAYTKDGTIPLKSPDNPLFVAGRSISKVSPPDKEQYALARLHQTVNTKIRSVKSVTAVTIDGLEGYEAIADAENTRTHTPLALYQVMLFDDGSYILMQGLVDARLSEEFLPDFKALALSLKRTRR